jgi:hypothetical protein
VPITTRQHSIVRLLISLCPSLLHTTVVTNVFCPSLFCYHCSDGPVIRGHNNLRHYSACCSSDGCIYPRDLAKNRLLMESYGADGIFFVLWFTSYGYGFSVHLWRAQSPITLLRKHVSILWKEFLVEMLLSDLNRIYYKRKRVTAKHWN